MLLLEYDRIGMGQIDKNDQMQGNGGNNESEEYKVEVV